MGVRLHWRENCLMADEERQQLIVELAAIDEYLASPEVFDTLDRVQGFHSMARLTTSNLATFEAHLRPLADRAFAAQLLDAPDASETLQYVERLQHLAANYFLSAVPLLEHIRLHVDTHYPDPDHPTRVQYERGLDMAINQYSGHPVVVQLRNFVAHRALPRITMLPGVHPEELATPTIDRRQILADSKVKNDLRQLLEQSDRDELSLSGLIRDDGLYVTEFVEWFAGILAMHSLDELRPIERKRQRRQQLLDQLDDAAP